MTRSLLFTLMSLLLPLFLNPLMAAGTDIRIPILCYHNFNPTRSGSMNLTPQRLEEQLQWLKDNGYTVIPLKQAVAYLQGERESLPPKSVVITVDDGWQSAYTYLAPVVRKFNVPVTLFVYPETIANGKNAMTWQELKSLQDSGLFDVQGHTYSHPNFKIAKRNMSSEKYTAYVANELSKSKRILESQLNKSVTLLAWPFGIYNKELERAAEQAGYTMSFSIDARTADRRFPAQSQPRYMIVAGQTMKTFQRIAGSATK